MNEIFLKFSFGIHQVCTWWGKEEGSPWKVQSKAGCLHQEHWEDPWGEWQRVAGRQGLHLGWSKCCYCTSSGNVPMHLCPFYISLIISPFAVDQSLCRCGVGGENTQAPCLEQEGPWPPQDKSSYGQQARCPLLNHNAMLWYWIWREINLKPMV